MKIAYVEEEQKKRRGGPGAGRPVLLCASVDIMEQKYLRKLRDEGGAVSARIGSHKSHFVDLQ